MIYWLIKLSLKRWRLVFLTTALLLAFLWHPVTLVARALMVVLSWGFILVRLAYQRPTRFEAGLPIRARDMFCARALSTLTLMWLFLLMFIAPLQDPHSAAQVGTTVFVFDAGAILTLVEIAGFYVQDGQIRAPLWRRWAVSAPALIAITVLSVENESTLAGVSQSALTLAGCALGSAALFWKTWFSLPHSLQIGPRESLVGKSRGGASRGWPRGRPIAGC